MLCLHSERFPNLCGRRRASGQGRVGSPSLPCPVVEALAAWAETPPTMAGTAAARLPQSSACLREGLQQSICAFLSQYGEIRLMR